jgi:hypothetical protein
MEQVTTMSESFIFEPLTLYTSDICGNNCLNLNNHYENMGVFHSIEIAAPCVQTAVAWLMGEKEVINQFVGYCGRFFFQNQTIKSISASFLMPSM